MTLYLKTVILIWHSLTMNTALHILVKDLNRSKDTLALIYAGAKTDIKNNNGKTVINLAEDKLQYLKNQYLDYKGSVHEYKFKNDFQFYSFIYNKAIGIN